MQDVSAEQLALHDDVAAVQAWGSANPEHFGGLWFDDDEALARRGPVRIGVALVSGTGEEVAADLRRRVRRQDLLRVVECAVTLRHLARLQEVVVDRHMAAGRPGEAAVSSTGVDVRGNRLRIGLSQEDEQLRARLTAELAGEPVAIAVGPVAVPTARR